MNWFANFWNQVKQFFGNFKITSDGNMTNRSQSGENSTPLPNTGVGQDINGVLGFDGNSDSNGLIGALKSWLYSMTGEHMPNADVERNAMQMQNQEDIFQRQVTGMQNAGINPALMYNSGASSGPSAPAPTVPGLNMSDIMQAMLLDKQGRLLESQIRNTDTQTDREAQETERLKLINKYYPKVTQTEIDKMLSEIGYNDESILKMKSEIELQDLEKDLKTIQKIISQAEADESSAYYKARRELMEAQTDKERQEKAELVVRTAMEEIERDFMKETNTKMGSATIVAIASALGTLISGFELPGLKNPFEGASESFLRDMRKLRDWFKNHTTAVD